MPGESTHRSGPIDKHPERGAEQTGLPGPGRTFGLGDNRAEESACGSSVL